MKPKLRHRVGLTLAFTFSVFLVFLITALIVGIISFFWIHFSPSASLERYPPFVLILILLASSTLVGGFVSLVMGRFPLKPIRKAITAINQLAGGDFSARLSISRPPELQELGDSFNRMAKELGSIEMLRTDFVNNFSHEFKTPIVSIKGYSEILKHADLTAEERNQYLDIIIRESGRLATLSTNVLNLSKVETQEILVDITRFNISEQIRQSILLLEPRWAAKALLFAVEMPEIRLRGNEEMLSQVWINLLDNAIKFTPQGGTITVEAHKKEPWVECSIHDSGVGIDQDALSHIFDKFYQGDASRSTAGNGLGLTLAQKIVHLHGGDITCESAPNQGTTFRVTLPLEPL